MKKLYVSDVDGTLYRGKSEGLSETGRELFIRLMQEGVGLTVASGRNLYGVYDLAASCGITLPVIAYNGAVIYDFGKGKAERTFPIQLADAQGLFERFDRQKIPYKTCVFRPQEERCVTYLQNGYRSPNWNRLWMCRCRSCWRESAYTSAPVGNSKPSPPSMSRQSRCRG